MSLEVVFGIGDEAGSLGRSFLADENEVLVGVWVRVEVVVYSELNCGPVEDGKSSFPRT